MQGPEVVLLAIEIGIRIEMEGPDPKGEIGGKAVIRIDGIEAKEVEVSLKGPLPNVAVEAQVPGMLEFIFAVNVTVPHSCVLPLKAHGHVIPELPPVESAQGQLGMGNVPGGIQVPKITRSPDANADLPGMHESFILRETPIPGTEEDSQKTNRDNGLHWARNVSGGLFLI
jgi:hypothetical protein